MNPYKLPTRSLKNVWRGCLFAAAGLKVLFSEERNSWVHLIAAVAVHVLGFFLKFSAGEWIAIWLCIGLVFVAEILNTAIENACDLISLEKNEQIRKIKDLGAGAVLMATIVSLVVVTITVFQSESFNILKLPPLGVDR